MISKGISKWLLGFKKLCQNKSKYKETKITIIKNKRKIDHQQRYKPGMVSLESIKLTTWTSLSSTETWASARKQNQALWSSMLKLVQPQMIKYLYTVCVLHKVKL